MSSVRISQPATSKTATPITSAGPAPSRGPDVERADERNGHWAGRFGRVVASGGVAAIPQALFSYQGALGLLAQEVWFVSSILADRWEDALPHTSLAKLARQSLLSGSQVRRIKLGLEQKHYLRTMPRHDDASAGQLSNYYDFAGLFERLERLVAADAPQANGILDEDAPAAFPATALAGEWSFVERYGRLLAGHGVATIPQALFTYQRELGLKPQHVWFCCYILAHKWSSDLPYPSLRKMEERTGYSRRQLQVIKEELIAAGQLEVVLRSDATNRQTSDGYDFGPLLDALARYLDRDRAAGRSAPVPQPVTAVPSVAGRRGRRASAAGAVLSCAGKYAAPASEQTPYASDSPSPYAYSSPSPYAPDSPAPAHLIHRGYAADSPSPYAPDSPSPYAPDSPESEVEESEIEEYDSNHAATQKKTDRDQTAPRYSPYIAGVIMDYSGELGDKANSASNTTQALRLWQSSGLNEERFVALLHQAKAITREYQGKQGRGIIANRMAYFFRVARDLIARSSSPGAANEVTP